MTLTAVSSIGIRLRLNPRCELVADAGTLRTSDHRRRRARLRLVCGQTASEGAGGGIGSRRLLGEVGVAGRTVTLDALHSCPKTAHLVVAGGDYIMPVNANHAALLDDIRILGFDAVPSRTTVDKAHGRIEERHCAVVPLDGFPDSVAPLPGRRQAFRVVRRRAVLATGRGSVEAAYGLTSLDSQVAGPSEILALNRGHSEIENRLHYVRDVAYDEDRSRVRVGRMPRNLACLSNAAISTRRGRRPTGACWRAGNVLHPGGRGVTPLDIDMGNTRTKWRFGDSISALPSPALPALDRAPSRVRVATVLRNHEDIALSIADRYGLAAEFAEPEAQLAGVRCGYDNPARLGVDRWLGVVAASQRSTGPVIVVSVGTAATVDFVRADGGHEGAHIAPGLRLLRDSLGRNTADVRAAGSHDPCVIPGVDTLTAVTSGTFLMLLAFVEAAIRGFAHRHGGEADVFLTGGDAELLLGRLSSPSRHAPHLVLDGLGIALP